MKKHLLENYLTTSSDCVVYQSEDGFFSAKFGKIYGFGKSQELAITALAQEIDRVEQSLIDLNRRIELDYIILKHEQEKATLQ